MDAKQYLSQIKKQDIIIESCLHEIARYQDIATCLGGGYNDGVKVQGSKGNVTEKNIILYVDKKEQLKEKINNANLKRSHIINQLEALDVKDYAILYKKYVQYKTLKELEYEMDMSHSGITYALKRAIVHFQEIIDKEKLYGELN